MSKPREDNENNKNNYKKSLLDFQNQHNFKRNYRKNKFQRNLFIEKISTESQCLRLSENQSLRHDTVQRIFYSQKIEKMNSSNNTYAFIPLQGSEHTCSCHNFITQKSIGAENPLYKCYFDL